MFGSNGHVAATRFCVEWHKDNGAVCDERPAFREHHIFGSRSQTNGVPQFSGSPHRTPSGCNHALRFGKVVRVESGFIAVHLKSLSPKAVKKRRKTTARRQRADNLLFRKTNGSYRGQNCRHRRTQADVRTNGAACNHYRKTDSTRGIACSATGEHERRLV